MRTLLLVILLSTLPGNSPPLQEAVGFFYAGQYQASIESFLFSLSEHPERSTEIRYNLGQSYLKLDSLDRSVAYFDQVSMVTDHAELSARAANQAGVIMVRKGQYGKALEYFHRALVMDEGNERARWNYELLSKRMQPPPPQDPPSGEDQDDEDDSLPPQSDLDPETLSQLLSQLRNRGELAASDQGRQIRDTLSLEEALQVLQSMEAQPVQFLQQLRKKPISVPRSYNKPRW